MTQEPFDVVIVPDFSGSRADVFALRTLFFLASWVEHAGAATDFPLHVACIGAPPATVSEAARSWGADVSVHQPVGIGSVMSNKLRGFEVRPKTGHILLLDADILVLGDLADLSHLAGSIAAQPIGKPPLRMRDWRSVYKIAGMDVPAERISSMLGDLLDPDLEHQRTPEQNAKLRRMVPMYHGGVVYAPWDVGLRDAWRDTFREISGQFVPDDPRWGWIAKNDEVPLAIAIEKLKQRGVSFARLPDMFHAQWPHFWGRYHWGEPRLFHLMGFLRAHEPVSKPAALAQTIREYCEANRRRHLDGDNRFKDVVRQDNESYIDFTKRLEAELLHLLDAHVAPALERGGARRVL